MKSHRRRSTVVPLVLLMSFLFEETQGLAFKEGLEGGNDRILEYRFSEQGGTTAADSGAGAPFSFNLTAGLAAGTIEWLPNSYGLALNLTAQRTTGPIAEDMEGALKVFNSTQLGENGLDFCFNYTMEAWLKNGADEPAPIFTFGTTMPYFLNLEYGIEDGFTNANFLRSFYDGSLSASTEASMNNMVPRSKGLVHVVTTYTTTVESARLGSMDSTGDLSFYYSGESVGESFVTFYVNGSGRVGPNDYHGSPLNMFGVESGTSLPRMSFAEIHSWNFVPSNQWKATAGFDAEQGWEGTLLYTAVWNRSLSAEEVAKSFAAGPPSIAPVASPNAVPLSEGTRQSLPFSARDGDQMGAGFDTVLCPVIVAVDEGLVSLSWDLAGLEPVTFGALPSSATCPYGSATGGSVYALVADYVGPLSLTYYVVDERGLLSNTATLTVTILPDQHPPTPTTSTPSVTVLAGLPLLSAPLILLNASDADSEESIVFTVLSLSSPTSLALYNTSGSPVLVGDLIVRPPFSGLPLLPSPATSFSSPLSFQPNYTHTLTFAVSNPALLPSLSANLTVEVTVLNDAFSSDVTQSLDEDTVDTAIELGGGSLLGGGVAMVFLIEELPAFGTLGGGLAVGSLTSATDVLYTPFPNAYGPDSFVYRAVSSVTGLAAPTTGTATLFVIDTYDAPTGEASTTAFFASSLTPIPIVLRALDTSSQLTFTVESLPSRGQLFQAGGLGALIDEPSTPILNVNASAPQGGLLNYVADSGEVPSGMPSLDDSFVWSIRNAVTTVNVTASLVLLQDLVVTNMVLTTTEDTPSPSTLFDVTDHYPGGLTQVTMSLLSGPTVSVGSGTTTPSAASSQSTLVIDSTSQPNTFIYTPGPNFDGTESFLVRATRTSGGPLVYMDLTITATVESVDDLPLVALPEEAYEVSDHTTLTVSGLTVRDVDSSSCNVTIEVLNGLGRLAARPSVVSTPSSTTTASPSFDEPPPEAFVSSLLFFPFVSVVDLPEGEPSPLDPFYFRSLDEDSLEADRISRIRVTAVTPEGLSSSLTVDVNVLSLLTPSSQLLTSGSSPGVNVAVLGGVGGGLLFLAIISVVVAYRCIKKDQKDGIPPFPPPPSFVNVIFEPLAGPEAGAALGPPTGSEASALASLEGLLVTVDLSFAMALMEVVKVEAMDVLARSLIRIFETRGESLRLLHLSISLEVSKALSTNTLFRLNCIASKLLKMYAKMIGMEYLYATLGPDIHALSFDTRSAEVDPSRLESSSLAGNEEGTRSTMSRSGTSFSGATGAGNAIPLNDLSSVSGGGRDVAMDEVDLEVESAASARAEALAARQLATTNTWALLETSQTILRSILKSVDDDAEVPFPTAFYEICSVLARESASRFPGSEGTVVGGFFFLRYVIPAVTDPTSVCILKTVSENTSRSLVLVAKTLQNLSNGVEFKESFMETANVFIRANRPAILAFFEKVAIVPEGATPTPPVKVPAAHHIDALRHVRRFVIKEQAAIKDFIEKNIDGAQAPPLLAGLQNVVGT